MPIVVYLDPSDYAAFGVAAATDPSIILRASLFVDGFLDRRDGLLYTEAMGEPVYMTKTGLPIREIYEVPLSQHITLSYTPLVKVLSIKANNKFAYNLPYPNTPPNFVDITTFDYETGYSDLWLQTAFPRAQATVKYIGGWTYATLPSEIKQATANISNVMSGIAGGLISSGNVTKFQAGDTSITFGLGGMADIDSVLSFYIDKDTARLLMPWKRNFR